MKVSILLTFIALIFPQSLANAELRDCAPKSTAFVLVNTQGAIIWNGIRLSIDAFSANSPPDASVTVGSGVVRLASNVASFQGKIRFKDNGFSIIDQSYCRDHRIALHCGKISYFADEAAASIKCSLTVFDPADLIEL